MRIAHKVNHGWLPNRNDPEWEERVEREAESSTAATERRYHTAQARLARAEARLARESSSRKVNAARLKSLAATVEERRQELLELSRLMNAHGSPSTSRGRKSHRGVPGTQPL